MVLKATEKSFKKLKYFTQTYKNKKKFKSNNEKNREDRYFFDSMSPFPYQFFLTCEIRFIKLDLHSISKISSFQITD